MGALCLLLLLSAQDSAQDKIRVEGLSLYVWKEAEEVAKGGDEGRKTQEELLKFCAERKVGRLYFMFSGKDAAPVRAFVKAAREARVQVHAMHPGDMAEWLDAFPERLDPKPILDWVAGTAKLGIFDGLHLDVEPHSTEGWKTQRAKLAAGYVDLLRQARKASEGTVLSAAVPDNWDRAELAVESGGATKLLIEHVQDVVDYVSVMAYRGRNAAKVLEAIAKECAYRPGRVELIQETDPKAVEEGAALHVGTAAALEAIFAQAREKQGPGLMLAVHHYGTWAALLR